MAAANSRQIVVGEAVVDLAIVEPDDIEAENSTNVTFTASLSGYGTEGSCFVWKLRSAGTATVTDDTCGGSFTRTLNPGFYNISLSAVLPNSRVVVADSSRSVLVTDGTDKTYLLSDFDYGVAVPAAIPSVPGTPVSSCAVAAEGYMFIRWSGDLPAEVVDPTNPELNFTADGSSVIKPVFGRVVNVNVAEPADESAAGNDESGDGSISAPYATVTRALQHARDALSAGLGPSVIALGDGTYSMIGNTVIDTPVRITALSGVRGSVTFSGSVIGQSHYDNGSVAGNQPGEALFYIDTDICVFDTLVIRWSGLYSGGRAVWARRGAVVRNCVIDGWTTKDCCADGVIALCDGSVMADSSVVNCTVKSLTGHYRRGGVFCQDGAAVVNCVITNNVASGSSYSKASALCAYGTGDFLVRNTLVAKCRCYCSTGQGNTIMSESAGVRLRLENVTLAECSILHSGSPAGLYIANSTSVACTNCVFHGSRNLDGASNVAFAGDVVKAKCTFGRCAFEIAIPDGIAGHNYVCAADDFKALAATPQDYTPHVASRLVSKGARLPWMTTSSQDILGRPRLVGTPDIGAFECQKTAHTLIWLR